MSSKPTRKNAARHHHVSLDANREIELSGQVLAGKRAEGEVDVSASPPAASV